jgi:hypothetical protein
MGTVEIDQTYNVGEEWASEIHQENMPRELRGPVNYTLYVPDIEEGIGGIRLGFADSPDQPLHNIGNGGIVEPYSNRFAAIASFQETYWHGVATHPDNDIENHEPAEGTPTLTTDGYEGRPLRFLDREWRDVLTGMNVNNRHFYQTPFHRERSYGPYQFDK